MLSVKQKSTEFPFTPTGSFVKSTVETNEGSFTKIRISSLFRAARLGDYFAEFHSLLLDTPQTDGLVLDIRDTTGGDAIIASALPQLIADAKRLIRVNKDQVRNTKLTQEIALEDIQKNGKTVTDRGANANAGIGTFFQNQQSETIQQARQFREQYFSSISVNAEFANSYESKRFTGSVIVLVNSNTFGGAENFAAVIQNSLVAPIIGVSSTTGGGSGGGFPVRYEQLSAIIPNKLPELPVFAFFPVTRTIRQGDFEGQSYNVFGLKVDKRYKYTKNDVLNNDKDLNLFLKRSLGNIGALAPTKQRFNVQNPFK